jgi:hypothetical protein
MSKESVGTLIRKRDAKLKVLGSVGPFISSSLCKVRTRCGKPDCRCADGDRHEAHILTKKVKGRTVSLYVPKDLLPEVEKWTREWKRIKKTLAEISAIDERIVRLHVRSQRAVRKNQSLAARIRPSPSTQE